MRFRLLPALFALISAGVLPAEAAAEGAAQKVQFKRNGDRIEVALNGRPLTNYYFGSQWAKPFLFPLRTASGVTVSRGWPVEPRPGEQQDHPWHRGIWYGHSDINGEDYWREKDDHSTARLVLRGDPEVLDGQGTINAVLDMASSKGTRAGTVRESFRFSTGRSLVYIDAVVSIDADQGQALRFGDSDDGGFGFRLADEFREDRGASLTNSEGLATSENMWGKPARWVHYAAKVEGRERGVAVFDHPANFRHPSTWHARGYSLCSANPFALASFTGDKSKDASYTLEAGKTLTFHYRVVIHDGSLASGKLEKLYKAWAQSR